MTLGKKLSNFRKIAGLTQQQLAEHLNISAQAISKWENDLSEPDLATLKSLAKLYNTSVDSLLDTDELAPQPQMIDAEAVANSVYEKIGDQIKSDAQPQPIGFCMNCGKTVTDETVAETEPHIICKKCKERLAEEAAERERAEREATERRIAELEEARERAVRAEERKKEIEMNSMRRHRSKSLLWGAAVAIALIVIGLIVIIQNSTDPDFKGDIASQIIGAIVLTYAGFAFTFTMFYDTFIKDAVLYMLTSSINWPGLIFTFDLDGILWLIGMKILFAVLGFIIGLLAAILGIIFGLIMSMIAFPFILLIYSSKITRGIYEDPELE